MPERAQDAAGVLSAGAGAIVLTDREPRCRTRFLDRPDATHQARLRNCSGSRPQAFHQGFSGRPRRLPRTHNRVSRTLACAVGTTVAVTCERWSSLVKTTTSVPGSL